MSQSLIPSPFKCMDKSNIIFFKSLGRLNCTNLALIGFILKLKSQSYKCFYLKLLNQSTAGPV